MISVDFTILLQMLNFLIILVIGKKMILDPVMGTVDKRNQKIDNLLAEASNLKETVEKQKNEYEVKLQDIKNEVAEHHKKVKDAILKETNAKIDEAKKAMSTKVKNAREEIQSEFEKAKLTLQDDAESFAASIVEKITGKAA